MRDDSSSGYFRHAVSTGGARQMHVTELLVVSRDSLHYATFPLIVDGAVLRRNPSAGGVSEAVVRCRIGRRPGALAMSGDERCTNAAVSSRVWYEYQNGAWTRRESGRTAGVPAEADNGRSVLPRVDPREVPKEFYRGCSYAQAELA